MNEHYLYHYYEADRGAFRNLSSLSDEEANKVMNDLKRDPALFASRRSDSYLAVRRELEHKARELFIAKGGKPLNRYPHYMTLGPCNWIKEWYKSGAELRIALREFDDRSISFTYGDLFPAMRYNDGKPYRGNVYTKSEIFGLIQEFGFPQEWNADGTCGPERYIEVQIWDEAVIGKYALR
ncbi:hypothetical protein [Paenibacillus sp. 32352]|uniref:hypothetical protein n=1 Tax=Paenibacillus sp. 32352 TaxID=1969111 RepID=UPI0009AD6AD3|nr:hypothetical protein [Paenibacillus sp. 32352]